MRGGERGVQGESLASSIWSGFQQFAKVKIGSASFSTAFDQDLWVVGDVRVNPTTATQGIYAQHRVSGDMGHKVHDGAASELRVTDATNTNFLNAHETSVVIGGSIDAHDVRSLTANVNAPPSATGKIASLAIIRAQRMWSLGSIAVNVVASVWAERQTVGAENWCVYAPDGDSFFDGVVLASPNGTRYRLTVADDGTLGTEAAR